MASSAACPQKVIESLPRCPAAQIGRSISRITVSPTKKVCVPAPAWRCAFPSSSTIRGKSGRVPRRQPKRSWSISRRRVGHLKAKLQVAIPFFSSTKQPRGTRKFASLRGPLLGQRVENRITFTDAGTGPFFGNARARTPRVAKVASRDREASTLKAIPRAKRVHRGPVQGWRRLDGVDSSPNPAIPSSPPPLAQARFKVVWIGQSHFRNRTTSGSSACRATKTSGTSSFPIASHLRIRESLQEIISPLTAWSQNLLTCPRQANLAS